MVCEDGIWVSAPGSITFLMVEFIIINVNFRILLAENKT
jgi:hypothetical protein